LLRFQQHSEVFSTPLIDRPIVLPPPFLMVFEKLLLFPSLAPFPDIVPFSLFQSPFCFKQNACTPFREPQNDFDSILPTNTPFAWCLRTLFSDEATQHRDLSRFSLPPSQLPPSFTPVVCCCSFSSPSLFLSFLPLRVRHC